MCENIERMRDGIVSTFGFLHASFKEKVTHHNKGFINYVFCRNWAARNPAGTMLDSLVIFTERNKKVWKSRTFLFVYQII